VRLGEPSPVNSTLSSSQMTSRPPRRSTCSTSCGCGQIKREYAQLLDVEASARGAHMSLTQTDQESRSAVTEPQLE
jgi:hypothetical protein